MNIDDKILNTIAWHVPRRGGVSLSILALPLFSVYKQKTIQNAISRLKQQQFVAFEGRHMVLSKKGKQYLANRKVLLRMFDPASLKSRPKSLIIVFDIPEDRKAEREWFRRQLKDFGYEMIQRSVWFGPGPLPSEFVEYVVSINLSESVKVFKASPLSITSPAK